MTLQWLRLHSADDRSVNEYGTWAYDIIRWKPNYLKKNVSYCNIVQHKSHMDWPGI